MVNPLILLALGAGALFLASKSKEESAAKQETGPYASLDPNMPPEIARAVQTALLQEGDVNRLLDFAQALRVGGYANSAAALEAKARMLPQPGRLPQPPGVAPPPYLPPVAPPIRPTPNLNPVINPDVQPPGPMPPGPGPVPLPGLENLLNNLPSILPNVLPGVLPPMPGAATYPNPGSMARTFTHDPGPAGYVILRSAPNSSAPWPGGSLTQTDRVTVLGSVPGQGGSWLHVQKANGVTGFVKPSVMQAAG